MSHPGLIDRAGQRFERLLVQERGPNRITVYPSGKKYNTRWWCVCDCGNRVLVDSWALASRNTRSCGCLKTESKRGRFGSRAGKAWKGGRYITPQGYVMLNVRMGGRSRSIFEHRLTLEQHLGRELLPDETVHHKNGIKTDNRLENLELRAKYHGPGCDPKELVRSAMATLARYSDLAQEIEFEAVGR